MSAPQSQTPKAESQVEPIIFYISAAVTGKPHDSHAPPTAALPKQGADFLYSVILTSTVCVASTVRILLTLSTTGTAGVCPLGTLKVLPISQTDI